ncbi:MAG: hypothetical protein HFH23_13550 [Ruminococcus sp.]|nr:hypothetical protein [Ruminococcus sp.]
MRRKRQEGAVVIEATISLTTVMFLIVTILSIVNICLVQAKISTLTHGIAKDISNYTYIYTLMGLNEKEAAISAKADYSRKTLDTAGKLPSEFKDGSTEVYGKISELSKTVMDKEFWESSLNLVAEGGINMIKGETVDGLCKLAARKRLASMGTDADTYLRHLGIEGGVDNGLHFERSEVCSGGGDDIKIIVEYEVHLLKLLGVDFNFRFEQCAYTKTWCARSGDDRRDVGGKKEDSKSEGSEGGENAGDAQADGQDGSGETDGSEESNGMENEEQTGGSDETEGQDETVTSGEETKQKTTREYISDSTHNPFSTQVYIGTMPGTLELGSSHEAMADLYGMTYFSMSKEDWNSLPKKDADAQWEIVKGFLEEQDGYGKNFYMGVNPRQASGIYRQEVEWLEDNGYTIEYDAEVGLWRAARK